MQQRAIDTVHHVMLVETHHLQQSLVHMQLLHAIST